KRKIIGREFVEVFQVEAGKLTNAKWLAQGTIYPDVIESAGKGKKGQTIKSHHNVGGLPETLNLKLLEPLRELFIALLQRRPKAEIDLWPSQTEAAARAADQSDDLVVSLPTSAGKTRIAELCIL
ncbi:hypothetical protein LTR94_034371, partial [Friedmanniomyces endolithicus]